MIKIEQMDIRPMLTGDLRNFVLSGTGPFIISSRCFVDKPRPPGPGFVTCSECEERRVESGEIVTIHTSPEVWQEREGYIEVNVENQLGETETLQFKVLPDSEGKPNITKTR